MTIRVGIISANWGAFAHLPAWRAIPGVEVTAICTSRRETAEAAAQKFGIARPFWDAQAMAADPDIDILDCGTRPSIREAMVLAALANGKHVYNGIPFAASLDGARALHDAWQDSGSVGVVDAYSQWLPTHRRMRAMLDDGTIGQPFGGTCLFNMGLFNPLKPDFPYNWFAQEGLGVSAVRNLGSHALHAMTYIFGPIEELVAHDARLIDQWTSADGAATIDAQTNDFATMLIRFASGLVLQFQVSWNAALGPGWHLDVFGSAGRMLMQAPSFPTMRDTTLQAGRLGEAMAPVVIPDSDMRSDRLTIDAAYPVAPAFPMALSMQAMIDAIRGDGKAAPDFAQAWAVERAQEAIRLSMAQRRWVRLNEIA